MSGGAAIAAVTAAMRHLLSQSLAADHDLADTVFTMQPPDIARAGGVTSNQLNLFLFRTAVNGAWSNHPLPDRTRPGEDGSPPLALTLLYLLTAYGKDNDMQLPYSHLLLGRAMGVLHDNPILAPDVLNAALPLSGLPRQIERVRLTLQPMSLDDLSKLWSGFQTQFRLSAAYEASVVLIESRRAVRAALPVLRRGSSGGGIALQADTQPPMPMLSDVQPGTAAIGATLALSGIHLAGERVVVRLTRDARAWDLTPEDAGTEHGLRVVLPADRSLSAGVHAISVLAGTADRLIPSNAMALAIRPRIVSKLPVAVKLGRNDGTFVLEIAPSLQPGQIASVLAGSSEIPLPPRDAAQSKITVSAAALDPGSYLLRVRVDGVDSPVIVTADDQPQFDPLARLTVAA